MKKIFALAITLIWTTSVINAQEDPTKYDMNIAIDNGDVVTVHSYRVDKITFCETPDPNEGWTSLGYCLYGEDIIASFLSYAGQTYSPCEYYVEVQECDTLPGLYRLVDPYGPDVYTLPEFMTYATAEDHYYLYVDATDPECVVIEDQYFGVDLVEYGGLYVQNEAYYYMARDGYTMEELKLYYSGWATLTNGVISFDCSHWEFFATLTSQYKLIWHSVDSHKGFKLDLNDKSDAPGPKETQDSSTKHDMNITIDNGDVVTIHMYRTDDITFCETPDPNEGWTSLGYCLYGEDIVASLFYYDGDEDYFLCEYYVEVQEKDDQPGLYRLVDPYGADVYPWTSFTIPATKEDHYYLYINACDPDAVIIERQYLGIDWAYYGELFVASEADIDMKAWGYTIDDVKWFDYGGTLKDGVITLGKYAYLYALMPSYYEYGMYYANRSNNFKLDLNDKSDAPGLKGKKGKARDLTNYSEDVVLKTENLVEMKKFAE